jgi:hypothetical protein
MLIAPRAGSSVAYAPRVHHRHGVLITPRARTSMAYAPRAHNRHIARSSKPIRSSRTMRPASPGLNDDQGVSGGASE